MRASHAVGGGHFACVCEPSFRLRDGTERLRVRQRTVLVCARFQIPTSNQDDDEGCVEQWNDGICVDGVMQAGRGMTSFVLFVFLKKDSWIGVAFFHDETETQRERHCVFFWFTTVERLALVFGDSMFYLPFRGCGALF